MRRAEHRCRLVIAGHAHAETVQPRLAGQLGKQRKIGCRLGIRRRNGHQARNRQRRLVRRGEQRGQFRNRATALLRLVADIDLQEAGRTPSGPLHRAGERRDQRRPVDGVDRVEQRDGVLGLVRLKLADEVQRDIRPRLAQSRPLRLRFLHAVLAIGALPCSEQRDDRLGVVQLGHGDQREVGPGTPGQRRGPVDRGANGGEPLGGVVVKHVPGYRHAHGTPPPRIADMLADDRRAAGRGLMVGAGRIAAGKRGRVPAPPDAA